MRKKYIVTCLVFLLTMLATVCHAQEKTARESLLVDAVQNINDGQYAEAKARLDAILQSDPENDAALYYSGICNIYLNNLADAEKSLTKAASLDTANYWYKDRLALLYSMTGQTEKTTAIYEALVKSHPKKTELYYNLVNLYGQQNRLDDMLKALDEIEYMSGKDESTTLARYDILIHQDKAEEAFNVLAAYNEDFASPTVLSRMGDAKLTSSEDSLALAYYDEALAESPDYAPALLGKSDVYRLRRSYGDFFKTLRQFVSSDNVPAAMKSQYLSNLSDNIDARFATAHKAALDSLYDAGTTAHPQDSSMLTTAATYYYRSDRKDKALELFKKNSEIYHDSFSAVATYIQALNYSEEWKQLREACDVASKSFPDEPAFLSMKSMADYNLEDYAAVIKDNQQMMSAFPGDTAVAVQAYSSMGDMYHMLGDVKQAFKMYDKALKINPRYAPVLNNYAYYLSLQGRKLNKAYAMSEITVEQEPDNSTYIDTFAWILHQQGKDLEAKSLFKHAMLYGGKDSAVMLDHYAEVLFALKEYDLAFSRWEQAQKLNTDNEIPDLDARVAARAKSIGR